MHGQQSDGLSSCQTQYFIKTQPLQVKCFLDVAWNPFFLMTLDTDTCALSINHYGVQIKY